MRLELIIDIFCEFFDMLVEIVQDVYKQFKCLWRVIVWIGEWEMFVIIYSWVAAVMCYQFFKCGVISNIKINVIEEEIL